MTHAEQIKQVEQVRKTIRSLDPLYDGAVIAALRVRASLLAAGKVEG